MPKNDKNHEKERNIKKSNNHKNVKKYQNNNKWFMEGGEYRVAESNA